MKWLPTLLLGIFLLLVTIFLYLKARKKHKKIDTCANAYVERVIDIGYSGGKKVYAITYNVTATPPFKVLLSPCTKAYRVGKRRKMYFEKDNAKENHYFSVLFLNIDRRYFPAISIAVFTVVAFVSAFMQIFGKG